MNEIVLDKVNKYIDSITYKLDKTSEEVIDYIEETKSNVIENVQELIEKGYTEDDALSIVFERFGAIDVLQHELNRFYKTKKFIKKSLLIISIVFLVFGITIRSIATSYDRHIQSLYYKTLLTPLINKAGTKENPISTEMENTLKTIVDNNSFIQAGALYITYEGAPMGDIYRYGAPPPYLKHNDFSFNYIYPSNDRTKQLSYFSKDTTGFIFKTYTDDNLRFSAFKNDNIIIQPVYKIKSVSPIIYYISGAFILAYWILFGTWASINIIYNLKGKLWIKLCSLRTSLMNSIYHCLFVQLKK